MANKNEEITEIPAENTETAETVDATVEETPVETMAAPVEAAQEETAPAAEVAAPAEKPAKAAKGAAPKAEVAATPEDGDVAVERGSRAQKVGIVKSDKMQLTCVVRVDRLIKHPRYRRYVRRRSSFMAHNDLGAAAGDRVRIVETRPLSAKKRWRVVEIIQKAQK